MADPPACSVTGYQVVCLDADIAIEATATPGTPIVTCLTTPTINAFGTRTCTSTGVPCGFSTQVSLCVAVPVDFSAKATVTGTSQQCELASDTSCVPGAAG